MSDALFISADSPGPEMNTSRYRVLIPAKYLQKAGHTIRLQSNPGVSTTVGGHDIDVDKHIDYSDVPEVVLIERNIQPSWIEKLRLAGAKRIVVTYDDNYGKLPDTAAAAPWWKRNYPLFLKALAMVDLVIVPSMVLVEEYKPYCKNIQYVPNFLDTDDWANLPERGEKKIIGWGGSAEHVESWKQKKVIHDLARVLEENPEWELFLVGRAIPQIAHLFPKGMKATWVDWVSYSEWIKIVASFSIGLAPLAGVYDNYRSNLKLVEYATAGAPWIASWAPPYTGGHVAGGIITKDSDWYSALSLLMKDSKARETLSSAGHRWAQGYLMENNVDNYTGILWPK